MSRGAKNLLGVGIILAVIAFYFYVCNINPNIDKDSPYYTNSLYLSNQKIYNDNLNDGEKAFYDLMIKNMLERNEKITFSFKDIKCENNYVDCANNIRKGFDALTIDHPEILGASGYSYSANKAEQTFQMTISYATAFKLVDYFGEASINVVLAKIKEDTEGMSDAEKIVYVYDWIGDRATYDFTFTLFDKNQSAYNAIVKRNAVCVGFAKTANLIFQYIGIESYGITGHTHMWNIVKLDGKYYFFDSTTAACLKKGSKNYYDGLKQTTMNDYGIDNMEWYESFNIETTDMPLNLG